jgi:hypothetical protein
LRFNFCWILNGRARTKPTRHFCHGH